MFLHSVWLDMGPGMCQSQWPAGTWFSLARVPWKMNYDLDHTEIWKGNWNVKYSPEEEMKLAIFLLLSYSMVICTLHLNTY